jgi:hypothetical protein
MSQSNDADGIGGALNSIYGGNAQTFGAYNPTNDLTLSQQSANNYNYDGQTSNQLVTQGELANRQGAAQADYTGANNAANVASGYQTGAQNAGLQNQQQGLALLGSAAAGNQPSAAAIQQQQGVQSALQTQLALAASARGSAGMADAQYNAGQNAAATQQSAVDNAASLRASEMATAQQAYSGAAAGLSAAGANAVQGAQAEQAQQAAQAQYQSTNQYNQTNQNTQNDLAYQGLAQNAAAAQLGANETEVGQQSTNYNAAMAANAAIEEQNAQNNTSSGNNIVSTIGDVIGHII